MTNKHFVASLGLVCVLSGFALAQKVNVDFDPKEDFSRYRTYAIVESKQPAPSAQCERSILDTIQVQLALKGLLPVTGSEPADLWLVYNAGVKEQTSIEGHDYGYGPGWRWAWSDKHSENYLQVQQPGTLVVDLVDVRQNRLVWRGIAVDVLGDRNNTNIRKVEKAAARMLAKYPTKQK